MEDGELREQLTLPNTLTRTDHCSKNSKFEKLKEFRASKSGDYDYRYDTALFAFWIGSTPGDHLVRLACNESGNGTYREEEDQARFR